MNRASRGIATAISLALFGSLIGAASAGADHHFMKIREISGSAAGAGNAYIELQMHAAGQNQVDGKTVRIYDNASVNPLDCVMDHNVAEGENQRTVLIGGDNMTNPGDIGNIRDISNCTGAVAFLQNGAQSNAGAACFVDADPPDCVAWGPITDTNLLPDPVASSTGADPLPDTMALRRSISPGCPTLLESGDDTNSGSDFAVVPRDPTPNSTVPVETACLLPPVMNQPANTGPTSKSKAKKCKKAKKKKKKKGKKRSASAAKKCKKKKKKKKKGKKK